MGGLPNDIFRDIVRRVGRGGFRDLGPLIAAGKESCNTVMTREVLEEVDMNEFVFTSSMANEDSPYRGFLLRCVAEGNVTACYIEGLRQVSRVSPSEYAFNLLRRAEATIANAAFALGVFQILAGEFEAGNEMIGKLFERVHTLEAAVQTGDFVMAEIATMGTERIGLYAPPGINYPVIPDCIYINCSVGDVCQACFAFWYVNKMTYLC